MFDAGAFQEMPVPTELPSPTSPSAMVGATTGAAGGGQSGEIWSNSGSEQGQDMCQKLSICQKKSQDTCEIFQENATVYVDIYETYVKVSGLRSARE